MTSFQINIPQSKYGVCPWTLPRKIRDWCSLFGLNEAHYCGNNSSGTGFTNGISNTEYCFIIKNAKETDAIAFRLTFPDCKVYSYTTGEILIKEVDWGTVTVDGKYDEFYADGGDWNDGTPLTDDELDALDPDKVYEIGYNDLICAAEYAYEGDR